MPGDPLWANVSLITGFEGEDGAEVFVDESLFAHAMTAAGGATTSTDRKRFGQSSGLFDGGNTRIQVPNGAAFDLANSDFTVEAWVWKVADRNVFNDSVVGVVGPSGLAWMCGFDRFNDRMFFRYSVNGSTTTKLDASYGLNFVDNAWNHAAWTRFGDRMIFHLNGAFIAAFDLTASIFFPVGQVVTIGSDGFANGTIDGSIDDLRITLGAPRYPFEIEIEAPTDPFERGPVTSAELVLQDITTLVCFLKMEAPGGDVKICDGGQIKFSSEVYESQHDVFGAIHTPDEFDAAFGNLAESESITLAPAADADVADWWRDDLFDVRVRVWLGELDADNFNVSDATLLGDYLIDTYSRMQGADGEDLLKIELMGRAEKLFLINEGNVCSQRFHQSVWPGENGFNNATDVIGYLAWGAATPPRASGVSGGTSSSFTQFNIGIRQ